MPGEPSFTPSSKSSSKAKRISNPRTQSGIDADQTQHSSHHYVSFRPDVEDSSIPPATRSKLFDLFQQIEKEFEVLCTENAGCEFYTTLFLFIFLIILYFSVQEKIDTLNEKLERECYGSGERSLPTVDLQDFTDTKNVTKSKSKIFISIEIYFNYILKY